MIRHHDRRRPSHDRWLISYADFITLLFAVFVVLYASSQTNKKQGEASDSIDAAFRALGIFPGGLSGAKNAAAGSNGAEKPDIPMNIVMSEDVLAPAKVKDDLDHLQREMQQTLSNQVANHTVSIKMGRDGLVISLREAGFFASGSATPKSQTLPTLRGIAAALSHTPYDLRIEGHTDNIPIHNAEFDSNWELSAARATSIARLLLALKAIPADRLAAAGYAEFHPVATNDTAKGRAENRRVDLVILPRSKINFSESNHPQPSGAWRRIADDK
ncbi:MAG TPA: OmpA family protein [Terracidiphilus sp.]|nr:OmpA family protein [Terracidiphilus sp.]